MAIKKKQSEKGNTKENEEHLSLKERCMKRAKELEEQRKQSENKPKPSTNNAPSELKAPNQESEFGTQEGEKVRDYLAESEQAESDIAEIKELAAQKILHRILNNSEYYDENSLALEITRIIKNITARDVIDRLLEDMECPLISKSGWDNCGDLTQGATEFCEEGNFMQCPAFGRYVLFMITANAKRKKEPKKEK